MIRPQRIDAGADHELILGVLGAQVVLEELRGLIAWLAACDASEPANPPELVDALLGIAALGADLDRQPPAAHDPLDDDAPLEGDDPLDADAHPPSRPSGHGDLLR